jgi:hypothetical protein
MLEARPMCPALFPSAAVPKPLSVNNRNLSSNLKMLLLVDRLAVYECYPSSSVFFFLLLLGLGFCLFLRARSLLWRAPVRFSCRRAFKLGRRGKLSVVFPDARTELKNPLQLGLNDLGELERVKGRAEALQFSNTLGIGNR